MVDWGKGILWYYLLQKRLLKKYSFLILLCLIPCFAWGIRLASNQEKGIMTIALCREGDDALSQKWIEELEQGKTVLHFVRAENAEEAEKMVKTGKADCAWVFQKDLEERIEWTARGKQFEGGLVTVLVREDNVAYRMAREKLYGTLYPDLSYMLYKNFIRENMGENGSISEERMKDIYQENTVRGSLFRRSYVNSKEEVQEAENYLVMPVRGLLALLIVLVGLACAMYMMQDKENGIFAWMKIENRLLFSYGYYMPAVLPAGFMVLAALKAEGVFLAWGKEILLMIVYLVITVSFCEMVRRICKRKERLCIVTPALLFMMLAVCPVFQDFKAFRPLQRIFPVFYYLQGLHNDKYLIYMIIYGIITVSINGLLKEE